MAVGEILDTLTDEQKKAVYAIVEAIEEEHNKEIANQLKELKKIKRMLAQRDAEMLNKITEIITGESEEKK